VIFVEWKNCCNTVSVYDQLVYNHFDVAVVIYTVITVLIYLLLCEKQFVKMCALLMFIGRGCCFEIENTMLLHSPM
jgi:hypothetical protein